VQWTVRLHVQQRCADCRLRMQIRSNCWIRRLTANGFFYSEVEMLQSQWIALKYCMQYDPLSQQQLSFLFSFCGQCYMFGAVVLPASMDNWMCIAWAGFCHQSISICWRVNFRQLLLLQKHAVYVMFIFSSSCLFVDVGMLQWMSRVQGCMSSASTLWSWIRNA